MPRRGHRPLPPGSGGRSPRRTREHETVAGVVEFEEFGIGTKPVKWMREPKPDFAAASRTLGVNRFLPG